MSLTRIFAQYLRCRREVVPSGGGVTEHDTRRAMFDYKMLMIMIALGAVASPRIACSQCLIQSDSLMNKDWTLEQCRHAKRRWIVCNMKGGGRASSSTSHEQARLLIDHGKRAKTLSSTLRHCQWSVYVLMLLLLLCVCVCVSVWVYM